MCEIINTNFTTGKILAAMVHSGVVSFNVGYCYSRYAKNKQE